ncbi:MFS transporter [Bacillus velezensis]|nr:MFS transporter [Bacillus velezensis]
MTYIRRGTLQFKKVNFALFAGGFCTFAILWGTQPLLPDIANDFHLSPAVSSLSQSAATIALAISLVFAGFLSEMYGRKQIMGVSLFAASILAVLTGFVSDFQLLVVCRALQGAALAGLPAAAMAYLAEEIEPDSLGMAMGLYISGNSIGGMTGRIISGFLTDSFSWHSALLTIGLISLLASIIFWTILPVSSHFTPRTYKRNDIFTSFYRQYRTPGFGCLLIIGFLLEAGFVSLYNYIGFQLMKPPYSLSQTAVGFIFLVYLVGTFSSTWMGMLADKYGKRKILPFSLVIVMIGVCITLSADIGIMILGVAIFTFGFFAGHSISSSWVGELAVRDKAQAAALYLFSYYVGGSIGGTASGAFYHLFGWGGIAVMITALSAVSAAVSVWLGLLTKRKKDKHQ